MNLYAESSAVLAWLLGEERGAACRQALSGAQTVFASDLTVIECERAILRAADTGMIREAEAADRRAALSAASIHWHVLRISGEVVYRSRRPFPVEPVRTLDAIHLASALVARGAGAGLAVLGLAGRIRRNAAALGFEILPAEPA